MSKVNFKFKHDPDLLNDAELESDDDLDEYWLEEKTKYIIPDDPQNTLQVIYLDLTRQEWADIGIRPSLWGQSRVVDDKVICYGSWHEDSTYQKTQEFDEPVKSMKELTLGILHEVSHGGYFLRGMPDRTHYHFYGLETPDADERYENTPTPLQAYREWLEPNENIEIYAIRTQELTEQFKKEVKDTERFIKKVHPSRSKKKEPKKVKPKQVRIKKRHLTPLSDHSWKGNTRQAVVLHTLLGSVKGSYSWLDEIDLSYHYLISEDGEIFEQIPIHRSAWHAGIPNNPKSQARKIFKGENPNRKSIGIAFARQGQRELTKEQAGACTQLIKKISKQTNIEYNEQNIFSHQDITSYKPKEVNTYKAQVLERLTGEAEPKQSNQQLLDKAKRLLAKLIKSLMGR